MHFRSNTLKTCASLSWVLVMLVVLSSEPTNAWLFFPECSDTCFVNYRLCKIESEGSRAKRDDELVSSLSCATKREDCLSKCPWWD
ncbi:hypothetical protein LSAT2_018228 [Lamellibrachia satsuma]|nr:hypothetical protein LSAT2_018228 [Lamellibrachia satsuma]